MKTHFKNDFFAGNRRNLCESNDTYPIVITANGQIQRSADSMYGFTQDANFWYLTGIDRPDVLLVIDDEGEFLILPEQSDYQKIFDVSATGNELAERSGIASVYSNEEGWKRLAASLKKTRRVATIAPPPSYIDFYGMYTNPARAALIKRVKAVGPGVKENDITPLLARQRVIKQPAEVAALRAAIDITSASLKEAFELKYDYEYELEAEIYRGFRRRGASGHAFEPIVAAGKRACTLHNVSNDAAIKAGSAVVVDVGAEVEHYAADITRTITFTKPSARQQAVYDAVLEVQRFGISLLKPGVSFEDYRDMTDKLMGEKLRELGLIRSLSPGNIRKYYPHSISHFLGLNVHDVGDYGEPLRPGMVLTVEPGIYIPKESIGVRIEDDILITDDGCEVLSGKLPRRLG